ncbi:AAA family ATPase [Streptomyces sp. NPDC048659]|uniref:caspase, EACC1-associated type n=1 Tax=Streptomyces sp. NPDC048659 TaxID=3155489 RepID=UPI00343B2CEB
MTGLTGPGVRVLLIATAHHDGPLLSSVPSVATSAHDLRKALVERCGVRAGNVRLLLDPADARTMARAIVDEAQRSQDVLLVWFIGHGLLGPEGELHLAARGTDRLTPGMAEHQALSFASLRQALGASRASYVVVVLDCCFSGRASLGGGPPVARSLDLAPVHGMYLMGAAEHLALAPSEARHTAFTGAVIELLTEGDPRGAPRLTLDAVFDGVFRKMSSRQQPLPRRQAGDRSGGLVLAPNPAVTVRHDEPPEEAGTARERCPYPGLDAFKADETDLFFGREGMTERLLDRMEHLARSLASTPLILVGPSGSGKSSLLNAGLTARLRERELFGTTPWLLLRLTPGPSPLPRLADLLGAAPATARATDGAAGPGGTYGDTDPAEPVRLAKRLTAGPPDRPGRRLILVVDQLEEVFTLCTAQERTAFLRALTALTRPAAEGGPGAVVVLALRADFYGQAVSHPELVTALGEGQLLVEPMTTAELRAAIEGPAAAVRLELDGGLADVILHELGATADASSAAGALPLLSHVLWATWARGTGTRLTVAQYRAAGGIDGAVAQTAEAAYEALDATGREAVRLMLPRLVRVGDGQADTAQPMDPSALMHGLPDTAAAQEAIDRFARARLLTVDRAAVRVSHEALLHTWPRLREWIEADRDWLRARQQLTADAAAWHQSGRDASLLYRGNRLAAVRERAASAPTSAAEPDSPYAEFLKASRRRERRGVRMLRATIAVLATLVLLAGIGLYGSFVFQRRAERASERDLARYLAAEAEGLRSQQPGLAKQLSLLSYRIDQDAGRSAIFNSVTTPGVINAEEPAYDLALSGDGRVLALSVGDAIVVRSPRGSARIAAEGIGPLAVSRDGRTLAAVTYDDRRPTTAWVRIWDLSDPARPRQTAAPTLEHAVPALALGQDGKTLYAGLTNGEIRLWDITDRTAPTPLPALRAHRGTVDSLAVSPRRDLLASMSLDGGIKLWSTADPRHPKAVATLQGQQYDRVAQANPRPLHRVAFDPDGRILAAPVAKRTSADMGLWRLDTPAAPRRMGPAKDSLIDSSIFCGGGITSVAFNPVRAYVAGSCEAEWHTWIYAETVVPGAILPGAQGGSQGLTAGMVTFDPGAPRRLLHATEKGVHVFFIDNPARLGARAVLPSVPGTGATFDYRKAGKDTLLALQGVGVNYLWDVTDFPDSAVLRTTTRSPDMFTGGSIALSPDGRLLADVELFPGRSGGKDDKKGGKKDGKKDGKPAELVGVRLRDTAAAPGAGPLSTIEDLDNGVQVIAFSPTAPVLAVSDMAGWTDRNHIPPSVRIYDIADPARPRQVARIKASTTSLDFSPDGRWLLLADSPFSPTDGPDAPGTPQPAVEGALEGWDLGNPARPQRRWSRPLPKRTDSLTTAFRPDGKLLATSDGTGTVSLWRFQQGRITEEVSQWRVRRNSPLAFNADGTRLALLGQNPADEFDSRPEIWDVSDPKTPTRRSYLPPSNSDQVYGLRFTPDGAYLALVRASMGIELWDVGPEPDLAGICASAGDPITPAQWKQYLPNETFRPPCR